MKTHSWRVPRAAVIAVILAGCGPSLQASSWPQAAGPQGTWQSAAADAPVRWSVARNQNILWRHPLPSGGQGGIAVWGDRLFVTTFGADLGDQKESNQVLGHCLDRSNGKILWSVALTGSRPGPVMYSFSDATSWTPITDGQHVWFFNSTGEMGAWDMSGQLLWRRTFRGQPEKYPFNRQLEPILFGDVIITVELLSPDEPGYRADRDDWNYLRGIDKLTGKTKWIAEDATTFYNTPVMGHLADGRPAVLHGRGGPHGVPELPIGLSMTSLVPGQEGKTIWRFEPTDVPGSPVDGTIYQALYTMHWDQRYAYWWRHAPDEAHLVLDANTGNLLREQSLSRNVDVRRWDEVQRKHVFFGGVNIRDLPDVPAYALKPGEVLHVFPAWHSNMVAGGYHYFLTSTNHHRNGYAPKGHCGPSHSIGRVDVESGKVEYLEIPVGVERKTGAPDELVYGRSLQTRIEDGQGRPIAAEPRSLTDGWQIAAFFPSPIVVGRRLYVSAQLGITYVIDTRAAVLDDKAIVSVNDLGPLGETWSLSGPATAAAFCITAAPKRSWQLAARPRVEACNPVSKPIWDLHDEPPDEVVCSRCRHLRLRRLRLRQFCRPPAGARDRRVHRGRRPAHARRIDPFRLGTFRISRHETAARVDKNVPSPIANLPNLKRVDNLIIKMESDQETFVHHFIAERSNGRLVIVHQGHACSLNDPVDTGGTNYGISRTIKGLLEAGYSVLGMYMPHIRPGQCDGGSVSCNRLFNTVKVQQGSVIKFYLEHIVVALNYVKTKSASDDFPSYRRYDMVGLSGGGWTTTVYAALDPTIRISIPVAGTSPLYMQKCVLGTTNPCDAEQMLPGFYQIAAYVELYVMGSLGPQRRQIQVLNRRDDCCYGEKQYFGPGANWDEVVHDYEARVKRVVSYKNAGSFRVFIDEESPNYQISTHALTTVILPELARE